MGTAVFDNCLMSEQRDISEMFLKIKEVDNSDKRLKDKQDFDSRMHKIMLRKSQHIN